MRNTAANRRNIVLVGPMGSGKSHVGRLLATRLGLAFVDVDARIEADAGMPIPAIFASEGEAGFRVRESRMLAGTLAQAGQVIATGGGAVLDAGNRTAMRTASKVVYLQVELQEQLRRLAGDTGRPLLDVADRAQRLAELQALREPLYREVANLLFDTAHQSPERVAEALAALIARDEEIHA
ncbi:shikimate kinase [Thermomonas sp. HDW16]|uniref:shikimate kinase n=1 Tax=Thermomonas sp. HDW16 TaxID=2714945 RepID=UPI00140DC016|nr:shikimate kinase [Thermomonas sp. HDW16]QIL20009.1 shikimate kinase [Thermomonas sp. HDW16]